MMRAEKLIVVTEGRSDVQIIRMLLGGESKSGMRFFAGQGRESLVTLGRNLLVHEGGPVLLVMDVSTAEMRFKDEMLAQTMRALSAVGSPGTFEVFAFTPEIEIVFFEAPEALQRAMGTTLVGTALAAQTLEEGRRSPKATLDRILEQAGIPKMESLTRRLDEQAIQSLCSGKQANALRGKVRAFCRLESLAGI